MKSNVSLKTVYEAEPCREEWDKFLAWALEVPYRWEEQMGKCVLDGIKESHPTWYQFFLEKGLVDEEPKRREVDWNKVTLERVDTGIFVRYDMWSLLKITERGVILCSGVMIPELSDLVDKEGKVKTIT